MKNLLFKELTLTIGKFFYLLPLLLGLLFFIPNWIFTLVPMYFFWISIPNIFSSYSAQLDYPFLSLLPVTKANIVVAKTVSIYIIQGIHIIFALIFGIIHNLIYGQYNFFLQINPIYFGIVFMIFGIFNIIVFPLYFKTAYRWGKPTIYGVIVTLIFAGLFEYAAAAIPSISKVLNSVNLYTQYSLFALGFFGGIILSIFATLLSIKNYEKIQ
ncbi:hypothetical protein HF295_07680 [Hujiaoplasma nucleasis]|uniref:ABC-2 transporter permease n=1 Tax=Hujiaoplasma nucleasis TaxID=2725268 RepID=A0A7L6N383_9MOLU|nr:ABC-2 transporter permease [Hujiaoplasma nucleasis]QLY40736.1 hypothetical protein HF295_07680 [Hujiaoplasma nucleasis]